MPVAPQLKNLLKVRSICARVPLRPTAMPLPYALITMFACSIVFVIKLVCASVHLLPVFHFLLVEPSIKFRGEFVALDLGVEVVGDDGVRLHG